MIPVKLEELILTGKAESDVLVHAAGRFGRWEINPDKLLIVYGLTIFPCVDHDETGGDYPVLCYTLQSLKSRQVFPYRTLHNAEQDGTMVGSPTYMPVYLIHQGVVTLDIRRYEDPRTWGVTNAPIRVEDGAEEQPYGLNGMNATEQIDLFPLAINPLVYVPYFNSQFPTPGANNQKPEPAADPGSVITSVYQQSGGHNTWPIIWLHVVLTNSGNFNKILAR